MYKKKNRKINLLTLGILVTMLTSSIPTFEVTNTNLDNMNNSIATKTSDGTPLVNALI